MEEELERKAKSPRKLAKVSFWDAEEKKLEKFQMKAGALIATESQGQERAEAEQLVNTISRMEYQVERTGDGSTKCQSGGPNLRRDASG